MAAFELEKLTESNVYYRDVIFSSHHQQLVLMNIPICDKIPNEIHDDTDQFIRIEKGSAEIIINGTDHYNLTDGDSITIPQNTYHEVINVGETPLKLYTIYSPPHHPIGTRQLFNHDDHD